MCAKKHTGHWLICLLLLYAGLPLTAQKLAPAEFTWVKKYSVEEGLQQSMATTVFQDPNGLIWIGTGEGLHNFDGHAFTAFRQQPDNPASLPGKIVRGIANAGNGKMFVSTPSAFALFDSRTGKFRTLCKPVASEPVLYTIALGGHNLGWCRDSGFVLLKDTLLVAANISWQSNQAPTQGFIPWSVVLLNKHTILAAGSEGVAEIRFPEKNVCGKATGIWKSFTTGRHCVAKTTDGVIWLSAGNKIGTYRSGTVADWQQYPQLDHVYAFFPGPDNQLHVTDRNKQKLYRLQNNRLTEVRLLTKEGRYTDTLSVDISTIYHDRDQNLWICTDGAGVLLHADKQTKLDMAPIGFTRSITGNGRFVWAGTYKNGLWKLEENLAARQKIVTKELGPNEEILHCKADARNRIWVATPDKILVLNQQGKTLFSYQANITIGRFFSNHTDTVLFSANSQLHYFYAGEKPRFVASQNAVCISAMLQDKNKQWIGTSGGLYQHNGNRLPDVRSLKPVLPVAVKCLVKQDSTIWVASATGIFLFSEKGSLLKKLNIRSLSDETFYSLLPDAEGRMWFSTNKGLGCLYEGGENVHLFDRAYNLQSLEFNSNAYYKSAAGDLYFGGINGINRVVPESFKPQRIVASPVLASANIAGKKVPAALLAGAAQSLEISWKQASISGRVFAPDYFQPEKQLYAFYLQHYDQGWNASRPSPDFAYQKLPAGNYTLFARYTDAFGNTGPARKVVSFTVLPPFWQTWWFILVSSVAALAIIVLCVRYLQALKYRRQIKMLEQRHALEKERLRISRDMHDELGSGLSRMMMVTDLAQKEFSGKEEVLAHLNSISRSARELHENMNSLVWMLNQEKQTFEVLFARIREFASELLEDAGIGFSMDLPDNGSEIVLFEEAARNIYLSVKEAINNIVKHSQANAVQLQVLLLPHSLVIKIADNGAGFNLQVPKNTGNGLKNLQVRAQMQHGNCSIQSACGKGTQITIELPLQHLIAKAADTTFV